ENHGIYINSDTNIAGDLTVGNDLTISGMFEAGGINLQSETSVIVNLEADTNNNDDGNPMIYLSQSGKYILSRIGLDQNNSLVFKTSHVGLEYHQSDIVFYTNGRNEPTTGTIITEPIERLRIEEDGDVIIQNTLKVDSIAGRTENCKIDNIEIVDLESRVTSVENDVDSIEELVDQNVKKTSS